MSTHRVTDECRAVGVYVRSSVTDCEVDVRQPGIASILIEQSRIGRVDL